jgi:hypothetical protein
VNVKFMKIMGQDGENTGREINDTLDRLGIETGDRQDISTSGATGLWPRPRPNQPRKQAAGTDRGEREKLPLPPTPQRPAGTRGDSGH